MSKSLQTLHTMESNNKVQNHQIYHNRGFYYFTFLIPTTLIYSASIVFYKKKNYIPYFEDIGINIPEKRLVEVAFNVCAWIMLTTLLITDGTIQVRNYKNKSIISGDKTSKNDFKYSIFRFLTCIFAGLTFLSCIAFGSILISDSLKYHYICCYLFLISSALYFSLVNVMFVIVKMNTTKEVNLNDTSNIGFIDWIHAIIAPVFFVISFLLKNNIVSIINNNINIFISKSLQYAGITLLFLNFVRILLRMPVINITLAYKKKE